MTEIERVTVTFDEFYKDLFPPEPIDWECRASRALDETREEGTHT